MSTNQRNYRATFILDNRGTEDTIEKIIEDVKPETAAVQGVVGNFENLGKRDSARVNDPKLVAATYVQIDLAAAATVPEALKERLRLKGHVYRTYIQLA